MVLVLALRGTVANTTDFLFVFPEEGKSTSSCNASLNDSDCVTDCVEWNTATEESEKPTSENSKPEP